MQHYEKMGVFYLGRRHEMPGTTAGEDAILYSSKDLTTHGVVVGMTGSGKTGLSLSILEEAAMDGIPAIAIDPKGDLGNLLLTFPDLQPSDFRPWIDEQEATRKGMSPDEFARDTAARWKKGLADWGQDGERIRAMKAKADFAIYTPGSSAGRPLSILRSLDAPAGPVRDDPEAMRERVQAAVAGLLALLGISGDPLRSRENILLANILDSTWQEGRHLDLPALIMAVQQPPFQKIGVFDLESFYPAKDRFDLAMSLNNLLASPGFGAWMEGEPLDVQNLLYTPEGKPRIAIISIAHLNESERMFIVTMVLNEILSWMRAQPGTSSLRAMLYMDEIFGYFPPTAEPPSKRPMLTLLKQARAYGLGVLLATQNPIDLDYKGLSNTGTWFIGRLQTERDKLRVLDGLEGAASSAGQAFDRASIERILSGLGNRVFLMNNVHEDGPVLFQTRWVMSYLRGPMTRQQIQMLEGGTRPTGAMQAQRTPSALASSAIQAANIEPLKSLPGLASKPPVATGIREFFVRPKEMPSEGEALVYRPRLAATCALHYVDAKSKIDVWQTVSLLAEAPEGHAPPDWASAEQLENLPDAASSPAAGARFDEVPSSLSAPRNFPLWGKQLQTWLYQSKPMGLFYCPSLKVYSQPGESEGAFRGRLSHRSREHRDMEIEKIRSRYASRIATLQDRLRRADQRIDTEKEQYKQQKVNTAVSLGATIMGALLGRKTASYGNLSRAGSTIKGAGRVSKEKGDIMRAEENRGAIEEQMREMEAELESEIQAIEDRVMAFDEKIEPYTCAPRKSDLILREIGLWWEPELR